MLLQGYPNIEYLIIDGKSTDRSVEVIKKYERWLTFWISEKDSGQSEAINKGLCRSTGHILAWINSDDLYHPGALEKVSRYFNTHQQVDMLYGDCDMIDENGGFIKRAPTLPFDLKSLICNKWFIPQQSTFIRRRVFEKAGRINTNLHLVMDWEYWVRIALNNFSISFFPERLASFRVYDLAKTSLYSQISGKEKLQVLNYYFSKKYSSDSIAPYRRQAFSYVNKWTGEAFLRNGQKFNAFYHFVKSAFFGPYRIKDPSFRSTVAKCFSVSPD